MQSKPTESNDPLQSGGMGALAKAFSWRFFFVYLIYIVFPFPVSLVPWVGEPVAEWVNKPVELLATLLGEELLGMERMDFTPNGSGDTSEAYVIVALGLILSVTLAAVWTLVSRQQTREWVAERMRLLARWYLGYYLLVYGFAKVIPLQFPMPNDFRLTQPLGEFSPMGIAWAFMGASPAYVIFSGAMEVLAGGLLLFRRTSNAGALLAAAVLTNVVAMNFCYDIPVKLFSTHLLLLALWIVLPNAKRLFAAIVLGRAVGAAVSERPFSRSWMERLRTPVGIVVVLYLSIYQVVTSIQRYHEVHERKSRFSLSGVYIPEGDAINRWTHFYVSSRGWVRVRKPGDESVVIYRIEGTESGADIDVSTITLIRYDDQFKRVDTATPLRFATQLDDGVLTLTPESEQGLRLRFRRKDTSTYLLRTRGFRWINEAPYNRP